MPRGWLRSRGRLLLMFTIYIWYLVFTFSIYYLLLLTDYDFRYNTEIPRYHPPERVRVRKFASRQGEIPTHITLYVKS